MHEISPFENQETEINDSAPYTEDASQKSPATQLPPIIKEARTLEPKDPVGDHLKRMLRDLGFISRADPNHPDNLTD